MEISEEIARKACELSIKAHKFCVNGSKQYLSEEIRMSSEDVLVFAFPGSWSKNDWFSRSPFGEKKMDLALFPSLRSIGHEETAYVNEAFLGSFELLLRISGLTTEVKKAVEAKSQIVFAGHSSGGPLAMLTTLWFLEIYTSNDCSITPRCVTFGSPLIGDRIFPHAIRRQNWDRYFINFVNRYDIVPLIMLAPLSSIDRQLPQILDFHNPNSSFFKNTGISNSADASAFYIDVLTKASSVASYVASRLKENTNLLVKNFSNFVELSPYRPFGRYVFCANGKSVVIDNPDAVLQMLCHFSRLCSEDVGSVVDSRKFNENLSYENASKNCFEMQNVVYLDSVSLEKQEIKTALDDLGMYTSTWLRFHAVLELEKQQVENEKNIDKESIAKHLGTIQKYQTECELRKDGYYDAFKIQKHESDFQANVARLELAGLWDEIVDMLKNGELPDTFEGKEVWIDLGTKFRRLSEPLDAANYYRHGRNNDAGSYLEKGRPRRYRFPQRWLEHHNGMKRFETISESSFWGQVEELKMNLKKESYEDMKERIVKLEGQVLKWYETGLLGKDVFLEKTTFTRWWKSLPEQHQKQSCLNFLFAIGNATAALNLNA